MFTPPQTLFSNFLLTEAIVANGDELASRWFDQTVTYRLQGASGFNVLTLGGHLRRSFLGALARSASPEALKELACPWDPPCALDIYMREQLRGAKGDGLAKPYVLFCVVDGDDLLVSLRVFGIANDWFYVAADALLAGMREILPWKRLFGVDMPEVTDRKIDQLDGVEVVKSASALKLQFLTPVDSSGKPDAIERSLLSRMLRRVDSIARWQGYAFDGDYARGLVLSLNDLDFSQSSLSKGFYKSPNRMHENRHHKTMMGELVVIGETSQLAAIVSIGERCHVGRAAIEGLGRFSINRS